MNIIELDRFMTKAARDALAEYFSGVKDADDHVRQCIKQWQHAFCTCNEFSMDAAVADASNFTGKPQEVCRRWLMAYAPIAKSTVHLELV